MMRTTPGSGAPTFAAMWREAAVRHATRPFLAWEQPTDRRIVTWTYEAFDVEVRRLATILAGRGVARGTRVHMVLPNCPMFVAVWLAATQLGAAIVPADPAGSPREYSLQISRTNPVIGVYGDHDRKRFKSSVSGRLDVLEVSVLGLSLPSPAERPMDWPDLPETHPADEAAILFTSGTTAEPKGVLVTQENYAFAAETMAGAADLQRSDRFIVVLPMFHANAQYYCFAPAIARGASVALMPGFSATRFLEQVARHHATHASLFAAPMRMLLARGRPTPVPQLRHVWFAQNVANNQYEALSEMFGCRPRQLYGMT